MVKNNFLSYGVIVGVGLGVALVVLAVLYCCWTRCCNEGASNPGRPGIVTGLRRASLYLSNTAPLDMSVSELFFNLARGPTDQPHHHPMTGHTRVQRPLLAPPGRHLCPPSYLPPPLPSLPAQRHQQIRRHLVSCQTTATPSPRRPAHGTRQYATLDERRKMETSSLSVSQMGTGRHNQRRMVHAGRERSESKVQSNRAQTEPCPLHHRERQPRRSPRLLPGSPLPEPPAQSPELIVSHFNSTASLPRLLQRPSPSPTPSWTYSKSLEQPSGSSTCDAPRFV
ncbi:hypothetical protein O3P69_000575 [Scylla paramamosain]|uniref:Uncharacterized protein n=1 Tax=Scylla paramamosain TaxID=85552 RepID=A0AAW0URF7_SCYPA